MPRKRNSRPRRGVDNPIDVEPRQTVPAAGFAALLERAVSEPGIISAAYHQFHGYSVGNQLLAWTQCLLRGLAPGPLATYARWKALGRQVRHGERAITLCMPVTVKHGMERTDEDAPRVFTRFVYRPNWFVLAQTDGPGISPQPIPSWDRELALAALDVSELPFDAYDGTSWDSPGRGPCQCLRSTRSHIRHGSMNLRTSCWATRPKATNATAS